MFALPFGEVSMFINIRNPVKFTARKWQVDIEFQLLLNLIFTPQQQ